ncbi:MAG: hypothetical protein ABIK83_01620 [Candidatus Zixiibacteriota bacterium]
MQKPIDHWTFWLVASGSGLVISVVIATIRDTLAIRLTSVVLAAASSSILFPLLVGYYYDKFKDAMTGGGIWGLIRLFVESGILRIYRHREYDGGGDTFEAASSAYGNAFDDYLKNTKLRADMTTNVKMVGVSLRVFFHDLGAYNRYIKQFFDPQMNRSEPEILALVCDPQENPEVDKRARIENSHANFPGIMQDVGITEGCINALNDGQPIPVIDYGFFRSAPYCTFVMFPDKCLYAPNILSKHNPAPLPMIIFKRGGYGYSVLEDYFKYLWDNRIEPQLRGAGH